MSQPIPTSSILFSPQSTNFSSTLSSLKRSTLSTQNRLSSISSDADFVINVASAYGLPLIANERCGSWYIRPESKAGSAYFKSTDGHTGQWKFSLRRLNVQVFDHVAKEGGVVIVDSTRRGKAMPDALMKTVPIWCAVFNRALFPEDPESWQLYTPPNCVSRSEHSQIEALIDGFAKDLESLRLNIPMLRKKVSKPLRPIWVTRDSKLPKAPPEYADFHPIVLCTASRRVIGTEVSEGGYIQGAGDDSEGWARGLTPDVFWQYRKGLLDASEEELPDLIISYLKDGDNVPKDSRAIAISPTAWLSVGSLNDAQDFTSRDYDAIITVAQRSSLPETKIMKTKHLHLECREHKLGSRDLRAQLPMLLSFFEKITSSTPRVLVCCSTGKDLSVGVALAILCLYSDPTGVFLQPITQSSVIDKTFIKQRLSWIMISYPYASPSRTTLQSINDFLLTAQPAANIALPIRQPPKAPAQIPRHISKESIFKQLTGTWTLTRSITNFRNDGLAGTVSGTATFAVRPPTSPTAKLEHLYRETGTFDAGPGIQLPVSRNWLWRFSSAKESEEEGMSIFFVKADGETADYLYNRFPSLLQRENAEEGEGLKVWRVEVEHPCDEDFYVSTYRFYVRQDRDSDGAVLEKWGVKHEVRGPAKDYISRTVHTRDQSVEMSL